MNTPQDGYPQLPYFLGCPVWSCPEWVGTVYSPRAPRTQWLAEYARVFNTVEGNTTFYGLPSNKAAERWAEQAGPGFQFALKFPRTITHDHLLRSAERETEAFLEVLAILDEHQRLGPSMLQLPPGFSPRMLPQLASYLEGLPTHYQYAVELRHHDFYDAGSAEREVDDLLKRLNIDKVLLDSRPLYSGPATDPHEKAAQSRKPKTPIRTTAIGQHPIVRFIGRNQVDRNAPWVQQWAITTAQWIRDGRQPFFFAHTPHCCYAPELAELFHQQLTTHLPSLPSLGIGNWPHQPTGPQQLQLFGGDD